MSVAKPGIADVRFGVDGSDADALNIVAPTSGLRDTGYPTNAVPTSGTFNYFRNRNYRWFQFLDEVFKVAGTAVGDMKLSGSANFGGSLTVGVNASITGDLTAGRILALVNAGYPIAAVSWLLESGTGAFGTGVWSLTASSKIVAPLRLPVGAVLTKVRYSYNLAAGGNSVFLGIGSMDTASGTVTETNLFTDPTSTTWTAQDVTTFGVNGSGFFNGSAGPHTIRADRTYWLIWTSTHVLNAQKLGGAVINP